MRAILEAACELITEESFTIEPEIMIPLVGDFRELKFVREYCIEEANEVIAAFEKNTGKKLKVPYTIGTMIELPRAALRAHVIAETAEFFSFGTNDLTQTTFGISRDDAASFIPTYQRKGIIEQDPFI